MAKGIEFVKHYKAHLGKFTGLAVSADGLRLCTTSDDQVSCCTGWQCCQPPSGFHMPLLVRLLPAPTQTMKFYDVTIFDMTVMVAVSYEPGCCEWVYRRGAPIPLVRAAA